MSWPELLPRTGLRGAVVMPRAPNNDFMSPSTPRLEECRRKPALPLLELRKSSTSTVRVQARDGGPRDDCLRMGPEGRTACVTTAGGINRS